MTYNLELNALKTVDNGNVVANAVFDDVKATPHTLQKDAAYEAASDTKIAVHEAGLSSKRR